MSDQLGTDLAVMIANLPGDLPREVEQEFRRGWNREKVLAAIRQKQIAQGQRVRRLIDGLGQMTMSVDPTLYHLWGQRLGYACWRDKQFRKEVLRDNPQARVQSRSSKIQVGFTIGKS